MIRELWHDVVHGDATDRFVSIALLACIGAAIALVLGFLAVLADASGMESRIADAVIVGKDREPAWVQPMKVGEVTTFVHHAESWHLSVSHAGGVGRLSVPERTFRNTHIGQLVTVSIRRGCFSGSLYVTEILGQP